MHAAAAQTKAAYGKTGYKYVSCSKSLSSKCKEFLRFISQQTKMDWNELKIFIHFNSFEQNMDWENSIYIISIPCHGLKWIVWPE